MDEYASSERRNKKKDKFRNKKKYPYKQGGANRLNISGTSVGKK